VSQTSVPLEETTKAKPRGNRRAIIRYRCAPATVGKVFSSEDQEFQRVWILDLSLKGIGMEMCRPLEVGNLVIISIRSNDRSKTLELSARVVRCNALPMGTWLVGCELSNEFSPEEMEQLL
jgi:hypothetical protein